MSQYNQSTQQTPVKCEDCGSRDFDIDLSRAEHFCTNCGLTIQILDNTVPFEETTNAQFSTNSSKNWRLEKMEKRIFSQGICQLFELSHAQLSYLNPTFGFNEKDNLRRFISDIKLAKTTDGKALIGRYPREFTSAVLTQFYLNINVQNKSVTEMTNSLMSISQRAESPCGDFLHSYPKPKKVLSKFLRRLKNYQKEVNFRLSTNRTGLEEVFEMRRRALHEMTKIAKRNGALPIDFTLDEDLLARINQSDVYPLSGQLMIGYHKELIWQLAKKRGINLSRAKLHKLTQVFECVPKFSAYSTKISSILN